MNLSKNRTIRKVGFYELLKTSFNNSKGRLCTLYSIKTDTLILPINYDTATELKESSTKQFKILVDSLILE